MLHQQYCTVDTAAQLHIRQPSKGSEQLDRALAKDPDGTMKMVSKIDSHEATAWKESDRDMIFQAIEKSIGFAMLDNALCARVMEFLRFNMETSQTVYVDAGQTVEERFQESQFLAGDRDRCGHDTNSMHAAATTNQGKGLDALDPDEYIAMSAADLENTSFAVEGAGDLFMSDMATLPPLEPPGSMPPGATGVYHLASSTLGPFDGLGTGGGAGEAGPGEVEEVQIKGDEESEILTGNIPGPGKGSGSGNGGEAAAPLMPVDSDV